MNKKGQVTIFVIVGILLVAIVGIFFLMKADIIPTPGGENPDEDPVGYLETCIEAKVLEGKNLIMKNGGYTDFDKEPTMDFMAAGETESSELAYLCYSSLGGEFPCVNQEPMLIQHLKTELKDFVGEEVEECWDKLMKSLTSKDNVVDTTEQTFEIRLTPNKIIVDIAGELILTKKGVPSVQKYFEVIIPSKFYDLAIVVQEIVSQEGSECSFDTLKYHQLHREYNFNVTTVSDGAEVYRVEHEKSKEEFTFAIKGCANPQDLPTA